MKRIPFLIAAAAVTVAAAPAYARALDGWASAEDVQSALENRGFKLGGKKISVDFGNCHGQKAYGTRTVTRGGVRVVEYHRFRCDALGLVADSYSVSIRITSSTASNFTMQVISAKRDT